jgi:Spy/CpxP family protein refolding chaperone
VKTWKVILAAVVIFVAGVLTGGVVVWKARSLPSLPAARNQTNAPSPWFIHRPDFLEVMKKELALTPQQSDKIAAAVRTSRQRTDFLWEMLKEPLQEELYLLKENILAVLEPEQQKKFEELIKPRPPRWEQGRRWGGEKEERGKPPGPGGPGAPPDGQKHPSGPPPWGAPPPPPGGKPPAGPIPAPPLPPQGTKPAPGGER